MNNDLILPDEHALSRESLRSQNPALVYLVSLKSEHSRRNLFRYLNQVAELLSNGQRNAFRLDWTQFNYSHMVGIRTKLSETYAPVTVNGMLSAVRGVLRTAWKLGQMSSDDYQRAVDVPNVKGVRLPAGHDLHYREIRALLAVCGIDEADQSLKGKRDAAVIAVLYATGMRRWEVAVLTATFPDTGRIHPLKVTFRFSPNGGKVHLANQTCLALSGGVTRRYRDPDNGVPKD